MHKVSFIGISVRIIFFIADEEAIKVFDFGAARLSDSKEGMAAEKVIKVGYSAPEQYRDVALQGFYTDIYSVGAILYQW